MITMIAARSSSTTNCRLREITVCSLVPSFARSLVCCFRHMFKSASIITDPSIVSRNEPPNADFGFLGCSGGSLSHRHRAYRSPRVQYRHTVANVGECARPRSLLSVLMLRLRRLIAANAPALYVASIRPGGQFVSITSLRRWPLQFI